MLRDEQDYLLRMIAAAAAVVARLRNKLTGLGGGSPEETVQQARAAQGELLGKDAMLLRALDPVSAVKILDPGRVKAWADLLDVEADALRASGKPEEASAIDARVRGLRPKQ